ncbi:uncharacterized protein LOC130053246 isoform X1 [Ostrea edulis]|uniref:uncharacterized protein LOC130053246 isoform X1 n=1 Tax=Ostrea edulis TaxID=37623 RepID=UPI0024AF4A14|nr:uncharacterized protein LOC130053246 isoform X1 [Ostrea edulis]
MADFVGRVKEIDNITDILCSPSSTKSAVILYGTKAVGKSSVAREVCKSMEDLEVHWVDLTHIGEAIKILEPLVITILNENHLIIDEENVDDLFDDLLERLCCRLTGPEKKHLIVFDNMDEVLERKLSTYMTKMIHTLACVDGVRILATSTIKLEVKHPYVLEMALEPLSIKDSENLLHKLCPCLNRNEMFYKVIDLCEGLPLVLKMTASEIDAGELTVDEIVCLLSQCRLKFLSQEFYPSTDRLGPVYLAFLRRLSKPLQDKLSMINYIPGTFDEKEAVGMMGREDSSTIGHLEAAIKHHVIHKYGIHKRLDIHGILRDCISEFMAIKNLPLVRTRFCKVFSEILRELDEKSRTSDYQVALCRLNQEQQNFNKLFKDVFHCTSDTYHIFVNIASYQYNMSTSAFMFNSPDSYEMGMVFYEECLRLTRKHGNDYDTSKVLNGLGRVVTNIKEDHVLGERHYREALRIRQRHHKQQDYFLAFLYQSLGWNLGCQGKTLDAILFLEKALKIELELGMYTENLILNTLQTLALFHLDLDHIDDGEKYQMEAFRRRRLAIGTDMHPIMGSMMNNVGEMYEKKGDFEEAESYFRRGLEIKTHTNAAVKSIVLSEINLANLLTDTGRADDALDVLHCSMNRMGKFSGIFEDTQSLVHESFGRAFREKGENIDQP